MPTFNMKMKDNFYYGDEPGQLHLLLRTKTQTVAWIKTMLSPRYTTPNNYPYAVPGDPAAEQSRKDRKEQTTYFGKVTGVRLIAYGRSFHFAAELTEKEKKPHCIWQLRIIRDPTLLEDMVVLWTANSSEETIEEAINNNNTKMVYNRFMNNYCQWKFNRMALFNNFVLGLPQHPHG